MTPDQLRAFLAVLEYGTFSRAAEALDLAQSTVSFHVKALEEGVGACLLERRGRAVRPTSAGAILRRDAKRLLAIHDDAIAKLGASEKGESGSVVVAASTIPAEHLLPPVLAAFRRTHPRVTVDVEVSDSKRALASLLGRSCDFAVVGSRVRDRRIRSTPVADDEIVLVGPVPNPFAPHGKLSPADLSKVPLVVREEGSGTADAVSRLLAKLPPERTHALLRVAGHAATVRCVLDGAGLALVSRRGVREELERGRLAVVALPGTPVRRRFFAAELAGARASGAARELLRAIVRDLR